MLDQMHRRATIANGQHWVDHHTLLMTQYDDVRRLAQLAADTNSLAAQVLNFSSVLIVCVLEHAWYIYCSVCKVDSMLYVMKLCVGGYLLLWCFSIAFVLS